MMDIVLMGKRIREARKARGMTAEQLAEKIGIATESLRHLECAARKPSLQTLYNIANVLDCSLDFLTGRSLSLEELLVQKGIESEELTEEQRKLLLEAATHLMPFIKKYH